MPNYPSEHGRHRPGRNQPKASNVQAFSVRQFFARFPNDEACLEHIMSVRHGLRRTCRKCGVIDSTFHRLAKRPAYACAHCGDHVYPCAGTVFQDTRTPLTVWFYAIYLFVTTRHGVSGKELQRQLGVTYKTAYRIGMQIRKLIGGVDEFVALKGHVEIDEAYVGGRYSGPRGRGALNKTIVVGLKERGGPMVTEIVPDATKATLRKIVLETVQPRTTVSTGGRGNTTLQCRLSPGRATGADVVRQDHSRTARRRSAGRGDHSLGRLRFGRLQWSQMDQNDIERRIGAPPV